MDSSKVPAYHITDRSIVDNIRDMWYAISLISFIGFIIVAKAIKPLVMPALALVYLGLLFWLKSLLP
jgi:hypothetical protein